MKTLKFITIYPEVYHNENLSPNEKIYLSVIRFFTLGKAHCCRLSDQVLSEELLIGLNQIRKIKCKLKKLGLISVDGKEIKYKKTLPNSNEILPNSNETLPNSNEILPNSNEILPNSNEILPNSNQNPCNTDENQQVAEGKDIKNKKEIKKEKEIKDVADRKRSDESSDDSFLSDWVEDALKKKEEYLKKEKDNSCSVVDMVTALPTPKEETTSKVEQVKEQYIDKNSIVNRMVVKIENMIESIKNCPTYSKTEKERVLKENSYNKVQLEKFFRKYIDEGDYDLKTLDEDNNYLKNITGNAFKSYLSEVNRESREVMTKKNPYSDLEDSNGYRETDRWKK